MDEFSLINQMCPHSPIFEREYNFFRYCFFKLYSGECSAYILNKTIFIIYI